MAAVFLYFQKELISFENYSKGVSFVCEPTCDGSSYKVFKEPVLSLFKSTHKCMVVIDYLESIEELNEVFKG